MGDLIETLRAQRDHAIAERDEAVARAEDAEAKVIDIDDIRREHAHLVTLHADITDAVERMSYAEQRAERAEAALAALREAAARVYSGPEGCITSPPCGACGWCDLGRTLADTAAAAEAHRARIVEETAAPLRAEIERLAICRRCGDTVTPGTMNARGVIHSAEGVECGMCTDDGGYERRVRAEALEAAADACDTGEPDSMAPWLRARAADERGGR